MDWQIDQQGWVTNCQRHPSPNFDQRPPDSDISLLVIHNISLPPGEFEKNAILDFFSNQLDANAHPYFAQIHTMKVSAHFLIDRQGQIIQLVSTRHRAWHAGVSSFNGRQRCNDFSIGIELIGADDQLFAAAQYQSLAQLCHCLQQYYPAISHANITGHSDIAPGRKTDPGPCFDWSHLRRLLQDLSG